MQDSYIGSTSASQAEEAGSITSILPPQDGRDAQHRSFWRSQKKMRRDTEVAQLPEYSRILLQKEMPSKWMAFLFGIWAPQRPLPVTFFDRYSSESVVIYLCCEEGGETP